MNADKKIESGRFVKIAEVLVRRTRYIFTFGHLRLSASICG
jgi:hypothetical protein